MSVKNLFQCQGRKVEVRRPWRPVHDHQIFSGCKRFGPLIHFLGNSASVYEVMLDAGRRMMTSKDTATS